MRADILEKLSYYQDQLLLWNERTALISLGDASHKELFKRHILDSLQLLTYLHFSDKRIADIGSGNGAPGLICAIADQRKDRQYSLIEKKPQKVTFLKMIVSALRLKNVEVIGGDVNACKFEHKFDVLTSRAFTYTEIGQNIIRNLLKPEKNAYFFLGSENKGYDFGVSSCYVFKSVTAEISKILMLKNGRKL